MSSGRVTFEHKARLKQILTCVSWENTTPTCAPHTHTQTYRFCYWCLVISGLCSAVRTEQGSAGVPALSYGSEGWRCTQ